MILIVGSVEQGEGGGAVRVGEEEEEDEGKKEMYTMLGYVRNGRKGMKRERTGDNDKRGAGGGD